MDVPSVGNTKECDRPECAAKKKCVEEIAFVVIYNKTKYDVKFEANRTVKELKAHLQSVIGVPQSLQKVMIRGMAKDDATLDELDVKNGTKVMVVGSKLVEILAVSSTKEESAEEEVVPVKDPMCREKKHKQILDKGKPEDAVVGIKNVKDSLPQFPLSGMVNRSGNKVRLTFKLETDQLWIATKERTDRYTMSTVKDVVSEPIEGHEEYHMLGIQFGTTEQSRYWIYWVPAQYVDAIKTTILGP